MLDKSTVATLIWVSIVLMTVGIGATYVALASLLRHDGTAWGFTANDSAFYPWTQRRFLESLLLGRLTLPIDHPARSSVTFARVLVTSAILLLMVTVALGFIYIKGLERHAG